MLDSIKEKLRSYTKYRSSIDRIIKNVASDDVLDKVERLRLLKFLNSARYHCQGRINKLKEFEKEN